MKETDNQIIHKFISVSITSRLSKDFTENTAKRIQEELVARKLENNNAFNLLIILISIYPFLVLLSNIIHSVFSIFGELQKINLNQIKNWTAQVSEILSTPLIIFSASALLILYFLDKYLRLRLE